jgi:hemerythrin-like domain-containing protein
MKPTEILSAEHRVIEQVLDCLEKIAERAESSRALDVASARTALEVLRTFADRCHHGKEENCLFPKLASCGFPTHVGPVAVMLQEHESGRAEIRGMDAALIDASRNDGNSVAYFVAAARRYVALLRDHIAKEESVLFPMAESLLTPADCDDIVKSFQAVELIDTRPGTHEKMLGLADALADRFQVARAAARGAPAFAGCCHAHGAPSDACSAH